MFHAPSKRAAQNDVHVAHDSVSCKRAIRSVAVQENRCLASVRTFMFMICSALQSHLLKRALAPAANTVPLKQAEAWRIVVGREDGKCASAGPWRRLLQSFNKRAGAAPSSSYTVKESPVYDARQAQLRESTWRRRTHAA